MMEDECLSADGTFRDDDQMSITSDPMEPAT